MEITVSLEKIKSVVSDYFQIEKSQLTENKKTKNLAYARQMYFYFAREFSKQSLYEIGKSVNRDHATALYGWNKTKVQKEIYKSISHDIFEIESKLLLNESVVFDVDLVKICEVNTQLKSLLI